MPRILIVEDEIIVAMFMEDILGEFGYEVAGVVTHLDEAMQREHDYDLAVLDVHLNGRNVFDFADKLTAEEVPFIFATGYGERGIPERHRGCPVLQKPFQPDDLRRALDRLVTATPKLAAHTSGQTIST
ncbi:MAG: response regulator [Pseudomonadota bacterium]